MKQIKKERKKEEKNEMQQNFCSNSNKITQTSSSRALSIPVFSSSVDIQSCIFSPPYVVVYGIIGNEALKS